MVPEHEGVGGLGLHDVLPVLDGEIVEWLVQGGRPWSGEGDARRGKRAPTFHHHEAPPLRPVVCVGALHWDVKARLTGQMIPGTSNPAVVSRTPGGVAGNIARTLARLGVPVSIVSVVGEDESGLGLVTRLAREGVNVDHVVTVSGAPTATYTAVLNGDGSLAVGVADMAIYERLDANVVDPVVKLYGTGALWCADANPATGGLASLAAVAERSCSIPSPSPRHRGCCRYSRGRQQYSRRRRGDGTHRIRRYRRGGDLFASQRGGTSRRHPR